MKETGMLCQNDNWSDERDTGYDGNVYTVLTQFQAELGSGPYWEVAGAGVR